MNKSGFKINFATTTTPKIKPKDITKISITEAPKLIDFPAITGNIASSGIDNKSWNNKIEKV